jgi:hypothetical protein
LGFVIGRALGCCSSGVEQRAEPYRAQVDVDPVAADVDAVDQGSEDSTPASYCCIVLIDLGVIARLGAVVADARFRACGSNQTHLERRL